MIKLRVNKKIFNIIGIVLIMAFTSVVTVFAERIISSSVVTYNNSNSGLSSTNVQEALDELYAKTKCLNENNYFDCFLKSLSISDTVLADDGTSNHNMRYTGKTPNNYVTFNDEEWRVIGVFNDIDNGVGKKETRVKIIKADSLGNKQWHTEYINIWKSAALNIELQSMSYASNSMVENAVWYLGDPGGDYNYTARQAYQFERGAKVASGNEATWIGKVALMYPSDYGFASSACNDGTKNLYEYNSSDVDCKGTDWLFTGSIEWLLSPNSSYTNEAREILANGRLFSSYHASYRVLSYYAVRPVVYLKSSVTCMNCSDSTAGTQSNPFVIG